MIEHLYTRPVRNNNISWLTLTHRQENLGLFKQTLRKKSRKSGVYNVCCLFSFRKCSFYLPKVCPNFLWPEEVTGMISLFNQRSGDVNIHLLSQHQRKSSLIIKKLHELVSRQLKKINKSKLYRYYRKWSNIQDKNILL